MSDQPELLSEELKALLRRAPTPAPPAGALERVRAQLVATVAMSVPTPAQPPGASAAPGAAAPTAAPLFGPLGATVVATALAVGAVGGIAVDRTLLRPPPVLAVEAPVRAPTVDEPERSPSVVPSPPPTPAPTPTPAPRRREASSLSTDAGQPSTVEVAHDDSLAQEQLLLETARAALVRGDAAGALEALLHHVTKFPAGRLSEERDALRVQALVSAGKHADAVEKARTFHENYPESLLSPVVDEAIRAP